MVNVCIKHEWELCLAAYHCYICVINKISNTWQDDYFVTVASYMNVFLWLFWLMEGWNQSTFHWFVFTVFRAVDGDFTDGDEFDSYTVIGTCRALYPFDGLYLLTCPHFRDCFIDSKYHFLQKLKSTLHFFFVLSCTSCLIFKAKF